MILRLHVFALSPYFYVRSGITSNTKFIVFGLMRPGLETKIYHTQAECTKNSLKILKGYYIQKPLIE
jgi:NADH:ubiquinone oxidoreductase subunit H